MSRCFVFLVIVLQALVACSDGHSDATASSPNSTALAVAGWAEELGPHTLQEFEHQFGNRVSLDPIVDNVTLETKLLTGRSGYDVVMPTNNFLQGLISSGALRKLDKTKIPNLKHLDPRILQLLAQSDAGNEYAVPYVWGTTGIGINVPAARKALGHDPPRSVQLLLDPKNARLLASCGIVWPDGGGWMMTAFAALALERDPSVSVAADLPVLEAALMRVRPFVRYIDSRPDSDLANGQICVTIGPSEGIAKARDAAHEAGNGVEIEYVLPDEGGLVWMDLLAVPRDAPNAEDALRFINYLLEPTVIAEVTNAAKIANPNLAADALIDPKVRQDPAIYPPPEAMSKLHRVAPESDENYVRERTRMWTRVRTR